MDIRGWDERYRQKNRAQEDYEAAPTELVVETAKRLAPGRALDLACGTGRNALWLAREGWGVTAVDGSAAAIEALRAQAEQQQVSVNGAVADLKDFQIAESGWDLIVIAYYLQRDLFERAQRGVAPGGVLIAIAHTTEGGEEATESRLLPGELKRYFVGWKIMHDYEGKPNDPAHRRRVAEIVAIRP